jgi:hypothetical protein
MPSQKPQHQASASIRVSPSTSCSTYSGSNSLGATSKVISTSFMKRMIRLTMRCSSFGFFHFGAAPSSPQTRGSHSAGMMDSGPIAIAVR